VASPVSRGFAMNKKSELALVSCGFALASSNRVRAASLRSTDPDSKPSKHAITDSQYSERGVLSLYPVYTQQTPMPLLPTAMVFVAHGFVLVQV
jgi:hypothetical protein